MLSVTLIILVGFLFLTSCYSSCPMIYKTSPQETTTLYSINTHQLTTQNSLTLQSISGSISKELSSVLYISGDEQYDIWLDEIQQQTDVVVDETYYNEPSELIDYLLDTYVKLSIINGFVIYDNIDNEMSISHAVTYCSGSRGLFIVHSSQAETYINKYNLSIVFNAETDVLPESLQFSDNSIVFQQHSAQPYLVDYAIFSDSPYLTWNDPDRDSHLERLSNVSKSCAAAFGWVSDEGSYVSHLADYGVFVHASDWAKNIVPLRNVNIPIPSLPKVTEGTVLDDNSVHTVTFIMTDGDNLQWLLGSFLQESWYGYTNMSSTPMGFTMAPALSEISSVSMSHIYTQASNLTGMIASPTGLGYIYPEQLTDEDLTTYAIETSEYMSNTQMRLLNILAGNDDISDETLQRSSCPFLQYNDIDAVLYYTYGSGYAGGKGKSIKDPVSGKPIITARFSLWDDETDPTKSVMLGNDGMISALMEQKKDATSVEGYSLIPVHAWSHTTADVAYIIDELKSQDPGVEVVTPAVFFSRFTSHVIY